MNITNLFGEQSKIIIKDIFIIFKALFALTVTLTCCRLVFDSSLA